MSVGSVNQINFDKYDINSADFKALTPEVRHEILLELQAQRRRPSWKFVDQLPQDSDKFSTFQIDRLMKRRMVQRSIDKNAKEMNSRRSDAVMDELSRRRIDMKDAVDLDTRRIASSDSAQYVFFKRRPDKGSMEGESETASADSQDSVEIEFSKQDDDSPAVFEDDWESYDSDDVMEIDSGPHISGENPAASDPTREGVSIETDRKKKTTLNG